MAPTLTDLQERARELNIAGRSKMDADELTAAIAAAEAAGNDAGGAQPGGSEPLTDAQTSTAGIAAPPELEPGTPDEVGRADLVELAAARAANRNPRVIGAETQED